jgi:hypothetical protein
MKKLRLAFDIDGTLCNNTMGRYYEAKPYTEMIKYVNELHDLGHYIIIHTARGMGRHENVPGKCFTSLYRLTQDQLDGWGVKYDELHLGKLHVDIFVDDKGFQVKPDGTSTNKLRDFVDGLINKSV